ncbi:hypothetical protein L596_003891 [Steinernema carpocapsae]|uniref:Uncharacterized protein n=1 Tax=Steinernema carpocapsae TaxID=34508 RepID=A0A4U8UU49_STECR|nr:hypothetical protein L596_003891 [Steinernema carpocapsae]
MAAGSSSHAAVLQMVQDCDAVFNDIYLERVLRHMLSKTKPESYSKLYRLHLEVVEQFRNLEVDPKKLSPRRKSTVEQRSPLPNPIVMARKESVRRSSVDPNHKLAVSVRDEFSANVLLV